MPVLERSIDIDAPAGDVWREVAHNFDKIASWASVLNTSEANPDVGAPDGAPVGGRVCETPSFGHVSETMISYDEDELRFSYQAQGLPSFVKRVQNTWQVTPLGAARARAAMKVEMDTGGVGKVMTPALRFHLGRQLDAVLDDLKHYVETGDVSAAKKKANAKLAKKRAA